MNGADSESEKQAGDNSRALKEKEQTTLVPYKPEDYRALFHLLTGSPDSTQRAYPKDIKVTLDDLSDLNRRVQDKLLTHKTAVDAVTVVVSFKNRVTKTFHGWDPFVHYGWNIPDVVQEVQITWDFALVLDQFKMPQRHTLTVTLTDGFNPFEMMRMIFSRTPDERDQGVAPEPSPMCARVTFISYTISQELLLILDEWNGAIRRVETDNKIIKALRKSESLVRLVTQAAPLLLVSGVGMYLYDFFVGHEMPLPALIRFTAFWLVVILITIAISINIAKVVADKIIQYVNRYGNRTIFAITRGDALVLKMQCNKDNGHLLKTAVGIIGTLALDVFGGWLTIKLFIK